ncbi:ubiquitin carboxyl-terminal hydrolase 7-like [Convolutriloba macropyga]|uniref:ubiquitin carboxyl-terminal hydrolase 7-like n=1 Tax=Convolutriloba macropyga TaxID=536237 RepID=UPI003F51EC7E
MAQTVDVEMADDGDKSAPCSPNNTGPLNTSKGQTAMNSSMIAKCVDRIKKLSETDVMLDNKTIGDKISPGSVAASSIPNQFSDEEMDIDNDDFRPDGYIRYVATGVSKWKDQAHNLSEPVMVRNMPWKILLMARPGQSHASQDAASGRSLGFFLQCNGENDSNTWNIHATAELSIVNQASPEKTQPRKINHTFYAKENDWGYSNFLLWKELVDPTKGWVKDDTIIAECKLHAEAPHGVDWDSKRLTGFVGLKNQGATCYMNSLLQSLYFISKFRKAVYQMPTEGEDSTKNVPLALQRVFYELQTSNRSVATKKLTRSFGWDNLDSFMQHDVQELTRVLMDNIETKMKGSHVEGVIPELFEGKMLSYISCKNVDYSSSREEPFYDIQLSVKGKKNVYESFKEYVAIEAMDGDNKYDAGSHGLQDADKGVIFTRFPPVLHLHLMRFYFDYHTEQNVKINDRYEFPQRLNLDPFLKEPEETAAVYILHAVLVHTGDNHGGHYVVYINALGDNKWCKFDDEVVSRCYAKEAVAHNYGGVDEHDNSVRNCTNAYMLVYIRESHLNKVLCPVEEADDIPKDLVDRLEEEKVIETQRRKEREEAQFYLNMSVVNEEAFHSNNSCDLVTIDSPRFVDFRVKKDSKYEDIIKILHDSYGYPENQMRLWPLIMRDNNTFRPTDLEWPSGKQLVEIAELESNAWRVFLELKPVVPTELTKPLPSFNKNDQICLFFKYYDIQISKAVYVGHMYVNHKKMKVKELYPELCKMAQITQCELIIYEEVRYYDLVLAKDHSHKLSEAFQDLMTGDILVFQRNDPDKVKHITHPGKELETEHFPLAKDYFINLSFMVDITFVERVPPAAATAVQHNGQPMSPAQQQNHQQQHQMWNQKCITLNINTKWTLAKTCRLLGEYLKQDPEHIQLLRPQGMSRSPGAPNLRSHDPESWTAIPSTFEGPIKDIIMQPGINSPAGLGPNAIQYRSRPTNMNTAAQYQPIKRLSFEVLEMRVSEFENRKKITIVIFDYETRDEHEMTLYPLKGGKVIDILYEAAKKLNLDLHKPPSGATAAHSPTGGGQSSQQLMVKELVGKLRLVELNNFKCNSIVDPFQSIDHALNLAGQHGRQLRIDFRFPENQRSTGPTDMLVGVASYSKEIFNCFGTPFYILCTSDESFGVIRDRICRFLDLSDKDSEKIKFTLVNQNQSQAVSNFNLDEKINIATQKEGAQKFTPRCMNSSVFLGLDHSTKSNVKRSRFQHFEKSIQILN